MALASLLLMSSDRGSGAHHQSIPCMLVAVEPTAPLAYKSCWHVTHAHYDIIRIVFNLQCLCATKLYQAEVLLPTTSPSLPVTSLYDRYQKSVSRILHDSLSRVEINITSGNTNSESNKRDQKGKNTSNEPDIHT